MEPDHYECCTCGGQGVDSYGETCGHCHGQRIPDPIDRIQQILSRGDPYNAGEDLSQYYRPITRDNRSRPLRVTSDAQGTLWLLVGTDSGYESTTALYYDTIRVVLEPVAQ